MSFCMHTQGPLAMQLRCRFFGSMWLHQPVEVENSKPFLEWGSSYLRQQTVHTGIMFNLGFASFLVFTKRQHCMIFCCTMLASCDPKLGSIFDQVDSVLIACASKRSVQASAT